MAAPPKLFLRFFRWYCDPGLKDHIEGDLMELYNDRVSESGKRKADLWFSIDVIQLFRRDIIRRMDISFSINQLSMFRNYLKVGIRNILKYKMFSFINVFGLAVAMSICMLIILMLMDRFRYDKFNEKGDRVYRILSSTENGRQPYATSPQPLADVIKSEYAVAEQVTYIVPNVGGDATYQERVAEMRGYFASPSFFDVFSFELEEGDKRTALSQPNTIIVSKALAEKLFRKDSPLGKVIDFSDRQLPFPGDYAGVGSPPVSWGTFTVTGVIDGSKYLSHLKFDVLMSSTSKPALDYEKGNEKWEWYWRTYTYILTKEDKGRNDLATALNDLVKRKYANLKSEEVKGFKLEPQALGEIQLGLSGNDTDNRLPMVGYYFLIILAGVVMITACLNYTNLSIARALTRAKEIGVRKVTGAGKGALVFQFLSESMITSVLALVMGILILLFVRPAFKSLWINQYLNFELPTTVTVYIIFFAFALMIGLIAGLYPAFQLSKYQPIKAIRNLNDVQPGKLGLRKVLSASQFVISLLFITTSLLVYNQFEHFLAFDYGFTTKNIMNIELQGMDYKKLSNELQGIKEISTISASDIVPATNRNNGIQFKKPQATNESINMGILVVDEHFIDNLDLKLIAGSNLSPGGLDSGRYIVINEAAVKVLGYAQPEQAIGQILETTWEKPEPMQIVGVVRDFRYHLLINRDKIEPLVMRNMPKEFQYLEVKVESSDMAKTIAEVESRWKKVDPIHVFKFEFYDKQLAETHRAILDLVSVLGTIAFLAIVIACLGLLGMAIYTAERKTKEVGIRKILGADEWSIALLLSNEFVKMLGASILIGAPLSYFLNNFWLQLIPNRVEFGLGTVLLGVLMLLILGFLTIGSQTFKAARNNPVEALRSE
ncbi:MAG: ABC transporter permease [Chryseolinea sp.]